MMSGDLFASDEAVPRVAAQASAESVVAPEPVAVRVRGLRKLYSGVVALAGMNLDVHRAEILALLGPIGAGKTTTVEILEGYRRRDGGLRSWSC